VEIFEILSQADLALDATDGFQFLDASGEAH
jgi:hypothetical protein